MGGDFPAKPMSLYATIWDGSSWATNGGRYRVNYKYAPFIAEFSEFVLHGCAVDPIEISPKCNDATNLESLSTTITPIQRAKMGNFRQKYMQYSYCYDRTRYKTPLPECVIDSREADKLRKFDPVTFGGVRHSRRGKQHRKKQSSQREATAI